MKLGVCWRVQGVDDEKDWKIWRWWWVLGLLWTVDLATERNHGEEHGDVTFAWYDVLVLFSLSRVSMCQRQCVSFSVLVWVLVVRCRGVWVEEWKLWSW
jgi:hypothetical protein